VRDVVTYGVPEDIIQSLRFWDISGFLADHDNKFTLVVQSLTFLGDGRDGDVVSRTGNRCNRLVEEHRELWYRHVGLLGMLLVVQAKAAYSPDILSVERRKEHFHLSNLVCDTMLAEDVALNHPRLARFGDVTDAGRKDGVAIVDVAVFSKEADQTLVEKINALEGRFNDM